MAHTMLGLLYLKCADLSRWLADRKFEELMLSFLSSKSSV